MQFGEATLHNELTAHNKYFLNLLKSIDLGSNLNMYTEINDKTLLKKIFLHVQKIVFWTFFQKNIFL